MFKTQKKFTLYSGDELESRATNEEVIFASNSFIIEFPCRPDAKVLNCSWPGMSKNLNGPKTSLKVPLCQGRVFSFNTVGPLASFPP